MATARRRRASIVVVNARRVDFDGAIAWSALERVGDVHAYDDCDCDASAIATRCARHDADVLVVKEIRVDVERLPNSVRMIAEAGTGTDNIDAKKARERGIAVCNAPAYSTEAVAALVCAYASASAVALCERHAALRMGDRRDFKRDFSGLTTFPTMFELRGKTIGLIGGTGAIGRAAARACRALGMRAVVHSRSATDEEGLWEAVSLETLLRTSDFVSVHCPLTEETRGMIDADALAMMKPTARLINTARGAIVNERDLIAALREKRIAGAMLDVQENEPPSDDSPLYTLENVYLTPHIGWKRVETRQRLVDMVAANVEAFLKGEPINVIAPA